MLHQNAGVGNIHIPYNWEVADSNARDALTNLTIGDIGKWCRLLNNNSIWMLTGVDPLSWSRVSGNMDGRESALLELLPPPSPGTKSLIAIDGVVSWGAAPTGMATSNYPQVADSIPAGDTMIIKSGNQYIVEEEFEVGNGANLEIEFDGNLIVRF